MPPSIVLEILRILNGEIDLRDLTRAAEESRTTKSPFEFQKESRALALTQEGLRERTDRVIIQLEEIQENENKNFARDIARLEKAEAAMKDAFDLLEKEETGAPTVAAETEAIEALLETKRGGKGGGGGGGNSPGGNTGGGDTDLMASALARLGEGVKAGPREVDQSVGGVSEAFPEEFRRGLDAYFRALDESE